MKRTLLSGFAILSCAVLVTAGSCQTTKSDTTTSTKTGKSQKSSLPIATIEMENGGIIKFEMYSDTAPKTVARITKLIQEGFYNPIPRKVTWILSTGQSTTAVLNNAVTFHRVVAGFVAQAGDPTGTGTGGSGVNIPAEFNIRKHIRGTVAMARSQDPNSADSQFYICFGTPSFLDGQYTIFGQVIQGMDVVDKIQQGDKIKKITVVLPNQNKNSDKIALTDTEKKKIDEWITKNNLNKYGDRQGTMYPGGTPLFNEMTGARTDVYEYIVKKHPDHPWNK